MLASKAAQKYMLTANPHTANACHCIVLFLSFHFATSFPLYYIHLIVFSHTAHLPLHNVAPFFPHVSATEQTEMNNSNLSLKQQRQSTAYRVITLPMNLCAPLALTDGER